MGHPPIHPGPNPPGAGSSSACAQLKNDIATYQALLDQLHRKLAGTQGYDERKKILDEIAVTARVLEDTETSYERNCVHGPIPPPPFHAGAWQLQSPYGIQLSDKVWVTGSVWAVHPLPGGRLLVGTEQGGLWISEPDGANSFKARCLSDSFTHWGFSAFVADPANPDRIFAGVNDTFSGLTQGLDGSFGGVFVGSASKPDDPWTFVPLPAPSGGVLSMIVVPGARRLVAACGTGTGANANPICWMNIDSSPLVWEVNPQTATDVANGVGDLFYVTDQRNAVLGIAGFAGSNIAVIAVGAGAIKWATPAPGFTPMRIASCRTKPNNAYCLGFVGSFQRLFVIRTQDAGKSWTEGSYLEPNVTTPGPTPAATFLAALDAFDAGVKSRYSIAVDPSDPLKVAVGYGAAALTNDGGTGQWLALNNAGTNPVVPMHDDVHELCFDDATGSLFVPTDGGLLTLPSTVALINPPLPFTVPGAFVPGDTRRNRTLPVMLMESSPKRVNIGNLAAGGGIVVSGTQDDANIWLNPSTLAWGALEIKSDPITRSAVTTGGDGGVVAISALSSGTYVLHGQNAPADKQPVNWDVWKDGVWVPWGTVKVMGAGNGLIPILRPVPPSVGLMAPAPVIALASQGNNIIYGAVVLTFPRMPPPFPTLPPQVVWVPLGAVPATETITALEPFDGGSVLAGTATGRLFRAGVNGTVTEISFDDGVGGSITGIASDGNTVLCINPAKLKAGPANGVYWGQPFSGAGAPLPLSRISTAALPPNEGSRFFRSISANRNSKFVRLTFALAIDQNEVWVSNSPVAAVWHKAVDGLPTAVRVSDLVFSETSSGGQLFLSTYGRSLWRLSF